MVTGFILSLCRWFRLRVGTGRASFPWGVIAKHWRQALHRPAHHLNTYGGSGVEPVITVGLPHHRHFYSPQLNISSGSLPVLRFGHVPSRVPPVVGHSEGRSGLVDCGLGNCEGRKEGIQRSLRALREGGRCGILSRDKDLETKTER